ncbi:MAG: flagellar hook capping protein [Lachnospiraceae bacterium]|nr:flagellar hook capping protein [Lachnospiraceae bacterium]
MSLVAPVMDGQVGGATSAASVAAEKQKKAAGSSTLDKESFLQLLVAQMKYQDPMEPTSNTEYISQYAQFSELEQMQNLGGSMNLQRASGLVGQYAVMSHTNEATGAVTTVEGKVDSVSFENNKAYLNIGGEPYSIDELTNVMDIDYANASELANAFAEKMAKLPDIDYLTLADKEDVGNLQALYNNMDVYQQGFITDRQVSSLQEYVARMALLVSNAEARASEAETSGTDTETSEDSGVSGVTEA